jgi:hypothetical protein
MDDKEIVKMYIMNVFKDGSVVLEELFNKSNSNEGLLLGVSPEEKESSLKLENYNDNKEKKRMVLIHDEVFEHDGYKTLNTLGLGRKALFPEGVRKKLVYICEIAEEAIDQYSTFNVMYLSMIKKEFSRINSINRTSIYKALIEISNTSNQQEFKNLIKECIDKHKKDIGMSALFKSIKSNIKSNTEHEFLNKKIEVINKKLRGDI